MGSRRLDISSLLCPDPTTEHHPSTSPTTIPEPVILAPHLRNPAVAPVPRRPSSPTPPSRRAHLDQPIDTDSIRHLPDQHRPHLPPRSIDTLIHPTSDQPRPSSSASLAARSPSTFTYPGVSSPSLSPLLHRPTSSHSPLSTQPRHTVVSQRSRSNTTTAATGFEALVHAATEERKRLSAGSPQAQSPKHSHSHHPTTTTTTITTSPSHDPLLRQQSSSRHPPLSLQQYEDEQRFLAQQERNRAELNRLEQQQKEQQRLLDHHREHRYREDEYREKRLQEERLREQQERHRLEEQQRLQQRRLLAEQELLERRRAQREQQRLLEEQEQRRRQEEEQRRRQEEEQRRRQEEEIQMRHHLEGERRRSEERRIFEERRLEEERKLQERLHREEELRRQEHLRREEEQRRREEQRRLEEDRIREEQRRLEEDRILEELRRREEHRRHEEHQRMEEQRRLAAEERLQQQRQREEHHRLRAAQEAHERQALQQQQQQQQHHHHHHHQEVRMSSEQPRSSYEDVHRHPLSPTTHSVTSRFAPAVIDIPPLHPYQPVSGPRKSEPIPIKRPASHDYPTLHISTSAPSSSVDDEPPAKKQRYSESPVRSSPPNAIQAQPKYSPQPSSSIEPYPRVVALPPPISIDFLNPRPNSSVVRRPSSGQGKRQAHNGLPDVLEREREKEKEKERERIAADNHRIISPLGRRSPPGSQIGRATAAKKSDEARRADEAAAAAAIADVRKMEEVHLQVKKADDVAPPSTSPPRSESRKAFQERGPVIALTRDSSIVKLEEATTRKPSDDASRKMSLDIVMNDAMVDVPVVKEESPLIPSFDVPSRSKELTPRPPRDDRVKPVSSRSADSNRIVVDAQTLPKKTREVKEVQDAAISRSRQDPHEWLLDHYAQSPVIPDKLPPEPPRSLSPSISPVLPKATSEKKSRTPPRAEIPKPVIALRSPSPDADAALERELAELMAEEEGGVPNHKTEPDDMDIDLAVAETLEENDKSNVAPMEVDAADEVEDELLSLVDDRPLPLPLPSSSAPAGRKVATPTIPAAPFGPPAQVKIGVNDFKHPSPAPIILNSPTTATPVVHPPSTPPGSDRGSMPPPSVAPRGKDKEEEVVKKSDLVAAASSQIAKKKKEAGSKATSKKTKEGATSTNSQTTSNNKQPKSKAAATKKSKGTDAAAATETKAAVKSAKSSTANRKATAVSHFTTSRSRSTSVMPTGSVEPEAERKSEEKEDDKEDVVDDKLYCVCKTKYDEDRFMIACDRCDEWYHTTCVNMPDMEVELVDQFFCPPCIEQNPHLNLKTTYKQRCLNGLRHSDPSSSKACHKPARGAISKYCSDECGVEYMQSRIDAWAKKGGKKEELWESVKNAEKREGVAVCVDERVKLDSEKKKKKQTKTDRERERLQGLLNQVLTIREETKSSMEILVWRERLLQLASERAEHIDQCGWDQRLCFGEEEWQDFGVGVLESYDDVKEVKDEDEMQVEEGEEEGEWWCLGQKSCKRHNGWQTLRYKDICKERDHKEELLTKLTTRERQLRKRIEDLGNSSGRKFNDSTSQVPLKLSNTRLSNGHAKSRGTTETLKKGKKRKAPAS